MEKSLIALRQLCVWTAFVGAVAGQSPIFQEVEIPFPPEAKGFLALGDFDQDGDIDAVSFGVNVFLNDGDAKFHPHPIPSVIITDYNTTLLRPMFAVADLNGDGYPDLVTTNGGLLVAWINQGNAVFVTAPGFFPVLPGVSGFAAVYPSAISAGDIDNDGDIDLVVARRGVGPSSGQAYVPVQPALLVKTPGGSFIHRARSRSASTPLRCFCGISIRMATWTSCS